MSEFIPNNNYREIIKSLPIMCVDVIIKNATGEILLIKRANKPLKNEWWVVGGRVLKGEKIADAVKRKTIQEVGLKLKDIKPLGYYEEIFNESPLGDRDTIHTVSFVFSAKVESGNVKLDNQSNGYSWFKHLPKRFTRNFTKANE